MLIIGEILFVLFLAFILTMFFSGICKRHGPWDNLFLFFSVLFLATLGIGLWIVPFGPVVFGFYWLPFLFIAVIISLFLAAVASSKKPADAKEARELAYEKMAVKKAIDIFLWVLIVILILMIFSGYFWGRGPVIPPAVGL